MIPRSLSPQRLFSPDKVLRDTPKPRSTSPVKRANVFLSNADLESVETGFRPPPYVSTNIQGYDYVHLSPLDQETVDSLIRLLSSAAGDEMLEEKLFDIVCIDFGAQIFLQHSHLFRLILQGLDSGDKSRFERSLIYISKIVKGLSISFRHHCDVPSSTGTTTPANNTPNVSVNVPLTNFEMTARTEFTISLPLACHEIFVRLASLLRFDDSFPLVISILQNVMPFVILYAESVVKTVNVESDPSGDETILYYFWLVFSELQQRPLQSGKSVIFNELLVFFSLQVLLYLGHLTNALPSLLVPALRVLVSDASHIDFIDFVSAEFLNKCDPNLVEFLSPLLHYKQPWGRKLFNMNLENCLEGGHYNLVSKFISYIVRREYKDLDDELKSRVNEWTHLCQNSSQSIDLSNNELQLVLEAFADHDSSKLNGFKSDLSCFRGLLHKSLKIRKQAYHELSKNPDFKVVFDRFDEPTELFAFSGSFLSAFKAEDVNVRLSSMSEANTSWSSFLEDHQGHERVLPLSLLGDLWVRLRNSTSNQQHEFMQAKVLETILYSIEHSQEHWYQKASGAHVLKIIRHMVENHREARQLVLAHFHILSTLFLNMDLSLPAIRFELARIIGGIGFTAFEQGIPNPMRGFEALSLPCSITDSFLLYGPITKLRNPESFTRLSKEGIEDVWGLLEEYLTNGIKSRDSKTQMMLSESVSRLNSAKSHSEFRDVIRSLIDCSHSNIALSILNSIQFQSSLERFMVIPPVRSDDQEVLVDILSFLRHSAISEGQHSQLFSLCSASLDKVLLPFLQKNIVSNESGTSDSATASRLAAEIMSFLRWFLNNLSPEEVKRIASTTSCISVIKDYTHHTFASESGNAKNHEGRINCLASLLYFASLSSLASSVRSDIIADMILLLVQVLGYSQQNYINSTHGNAFTYKDRSVYQWVALCLRNLSRTVVIDGTTHVAWTENWLFNGDLEWLVILLNDDEKIMQKLGLGILGNMILVRGSYPYVCAKIPQFLDMAFSFVLDFEQHYTRRTEALLIINNFIAPFCQGISNQASGFGVASSVDPGAEIVKICENSGFFDRLRDLLEAPTDMVSYKLALSELLSNLLLVVPEITSEKLLSVDTLEFLVVYATQTPESVEVGFDSQSTLYSRFRKEQFLSIYSDLILACAAHSLHILRFLIAGDETKMESVLRRTSLVSRLTNVFDSTKERLSRPNREQTDAAYSKMLEHCFFLFGDLLLRLTSMSPEEITSLFLYHSSGSNLLWVLCHSLRKASDLELRRGACYLLSRLFAIHYGEVLNLGLEKILSNPVSDDSKSKSMSVVLTEEFTRILIEDYDPEDPVLMESVRLSLQCLLGRSEPAKTFALSIQFPKILAQKAWSVLLSFHGKIDDSRQVDLFLIISLFRHLLAGSRDAKIKCGEAQLAKILLEVITLKDIRDALLLESLECLRNLIANSDATKKLAIDARKKSDLRNPSSPTILETLSSLLLDHRRSDEVFTATLEVLKIFVLHPESRFQLIKREFAGHVVESLSKAVRFKMLSRVDGLLQYLINLTFCTDGQLHVVKIDGFLTLIPELLVAKAVKTRNLAGLLLRNVAIPRENKARFLAHDNFFDILEQSLATKALKVLAPLCSFTWVLLYDSEKVKAALKQSKVKEALARLEERLRQDYAWHLLQSNDGYSQDITREDDECLKQILRDLTVINKLLK